MPKAQIPYGNWCAFVQGKLYCAVKGVSMNVRKYYTIKETIRGETYGKSGEPIDRVAAMAVFENPFTGEFVDDLSSLFELGGEIAMRLSDDAVSVMNGRPISYGKGAIVGSAGDFEHGAALVHPRLGKSLRASVGGGDAIIPSNVKVGVVGSSIDIPLGHKDDVWSFDHFDTMTVSIPDSPRPNELVLIVVVADGGRMLARSGSKPAV